MARKYKSQEVREYGAWQRMWSRARGTANAAAKVNYLDRGIGVCDRWRSFDSFLSDMGPMPAGTWLDRIDNDLGYQPGNCRWTTPTEQQRNRRSNKLIHWNGETLCMSAWAERLNMTKGALWGRLKRGWTIEDAITTPGRERRQEVSK